MKKDTNHKENKKQRPKRHSKLIFGMLFLLLVGILSACAYFEKASEPEMSEQEFIQPPPGTVQLYHATEDGIEPDSELYQLKQPDNLTATIEELVECMQLDEHISIERFSIDEEKNVSLYITRDGEVSSESWLLNQAAIVKNIEELEINKVIIVLIDENGNEISTATYSDASFYYY
ncbi:MAG: hypothetical protein IKS48_13105 [Eubacterium sp.]|nr:hypothetical protein [Eubacterium sp.]